jgi:hypothetical protein
VIRRWNLRTPGREEETTDTGQPELADAPATDAAAGNTPVVDAARPDESPRGTSTN